MTPGARSRATVIPTRRSANCCPTPPRSQTSSASFWGMTTTEINHGPAQAVHEHRFGQFGRPSMGAWSPTGSEARPRTCRASSSCNWFTRPSGAAHRSGTWFLPPHFQGTPSVPGPEPVLHLQVLKASTRTSNASSSRPCATSIGCASTRSRTRDHSHIAAYEMAFRMQSSAPDLVDLEREPREVTTCYGIEDARPSFARNCLLARRMVERGIRFVQLYHADWDHHGDPDNNLGHRSRTGAARSTARLPRSSRT